MSCLQFLFWEMIGSFRNLVVVVVRVRVRVVGVVVRVVGVTEIDLGKVVSRIGEQ